MLELVIPLRCSLVLLVIECIDLVRVPFPLENKLGFQVKGWIIDYLGKDGHLFPGKVVVLCYVRFILSQIQCFLRTTFVLVKGHLVPVDNCGFSTIVIEEKLSHSPNIFQVFKNVLFVFFGNLNFYLALKGQHYIRASTYVSTCQRMHFAFLQALTLLAQTTTFGRNF